jgi:glycosyltransferase involved in cell wall biosynthesis
MKSDTILIITPSAEPNIGGVESHIDSLRLLIKKNTQNAVIITNKPLYAETKEKSVEDYSASSLNKYKTDNNNNNFKYIYISPPLYVTITKKKTNNLIKNIMYWYSLLYMIIFSYLYILFNSSKIKLIHGHEHYGGIISYVLYKIFKKKYIVTIHTYCGVNNKHYFAKIIKRCLSPANRVFVSSNKVLDELKNFGITNIQPYKQWIYTRAYYPITNKKKFDISVDVKKTINILIIGRFSKEKGFDDILKKLINKKIEKNKSKKIYKRKIQILIIGEGHLNFQYIQKHLKKNMKDSVIENILFLGSKNNNNLNKYYNITDYTIIPDILSGNVPRTIMESLASGTPLLYLDNNLEKYSWFRRLQKDNVISNLENLRKKNLRDIQICRKVAIKRFGEKNSEIFKKYYFS